MGWRWGDVEWAGSRSVQIGIIVQWVVGFRREVVPAVDSSWSAAGYERSGRRVSDVSRLSSLD